VANAEAAVWPLGAVPVPVLHDKAWIETDKLVDYFV
jgi:hypothetical protein